MKYTPKYELYLVRDIIDMALEYSTDKNTLEYISSNCFNLDMIFENSHSGIKWHEVFNILDSWAFTEDVNQAAFQRDIEVLTKLRNTYQSQIDTIAKEGHRA